MLLTSPAITEIYTLSLHDALPILQSQLKKEDSSSESLICKFSRLVRFGGQRVECAADSHPSVNSQQSGNRPRDRKSTRLNSSHRTISYAVFCLKKKTKSRSTSTPS